MKFGLVPGMDYPNVFEELLLLFCSAKVIKFWLTYSPGNRRSSSVAYEKEDHSIFLLDTVRPADLPSNYVDYSSKVVNNFSFL